MRILLYKKNHLINSCGGVNELIQNERNGYLVQNVDELAEKLNLLINDKELRKNLGNEAHKITQKCELRSIINQWDKLIISVIKDIK